LHAVFILRFHTSHNRFVREEDRQREQLLICRRFFFCLPKSVDFDFPAWGDAPS